MWHFIVYSFAEFTKVKKKQKKTFSSYTYSLNLLKKKKIRPVDGSALQVYSCMRMPQHLFKKMSMTKMGVHIEKVQNFTQQSLTRRSSLSVYPSQISAASMLKPKRQPDHVFVVETKQTNSK